MVESLVAGHRSTGNGDADVVPRYTIGGRAPSDVRDDDAGIALPNGAQALLEAEYENMLACVRCGLCLTSCPTYVLTGNENEGPRGRIALARALTEGRIPLTDELLTHEDTCLACDACTDVCPAGVRMEPIQVALRSAVEPAVRRPVWVRALRTVVFDWLFPSMPRFRFLVWLVWMYQVSGLRTVLRATGVLRLIGMSAADDLLPPFAPHFLISSGQTYPPEGDRSDRVETVDFFAGCVMSTALAAIDHATVRVLQRSGCAVSCPSGQGCCGALHAHSGDRTGAVSLARSTIASFEAGGDHPVIVNSAGCGAMLKEYGHFLADDPDWASRARRFSARVVDVSEFLATRTLPTMHPISAGSVRVTYQDACHLSHAQKITSQPRDLLRAIPGLELAEMPERSLCCGSAGVYNVTHPETARELGSRKAESINATGAEVVVTANPGCYLQLRARLRATGSKTEVRHIMELLDEASAPVVAR